jgi:hypothetical protein
MSFLILLLNNSPCKQRRQPSANTPHPQPLSQGERGVKDSLALWERGVKDSLSLWERGGVRAQVEVSHD